MDNTLTPSQYSSLNKVFLTVSNGGLENFFITRDKLVSCDFRYVELRKHNMISAVMHNHEEISDKTKFRHNPTGLYCSKMSMS